MIEDLPPLPPELRALLDRERAISPLSPAVRARALAAARAAMAAGTVPAPARAPAAWPRWAAAAAVVCVAAGAAATVAYRRLEGERRAASAPAVPDLHERTAPGLAPGPPTAPAPPPERPAAPSRTSPTAPFPRGPAEDSPRHARIAVPREELRLLRQARAAVAREDFAAALPPIAEHTRDFPNGRLAEEREALRVKALVGLGRNAEARRAATSFAARFPRSVLQPAIRGMSAGQK